MNLTTKLAGACAAVALICVPSAGMPAAQAAGTSASTNSASVSQVRVAADTDYVAGWIS